LKERFAGSAANAVDSAADAVDAAANTADATPRFRAAMSARATRRFWAN